MNTTTATTTAVPSVPMSKMEVASQIMEEEKEADKETSKRSTIMEEEEEEEDCDDNCSCAYESDYIYEDISDNEDEDEQRVHHRYRHHQEQEDLRSLEEVGMKRKHPPSEGRGKKATAAGLKTTGLDDFSTAASTPKRSSLSYYSSSPRPSPSLLLVELSPAFCQTCQGEIHTPVRHCEQVQEWLDRQITVASSGVFFFAPNLMIPAMKRRLKQVLDELPDDEEHQRFYENDRATGYAELQQIMRQYRWDVQAWLRPIINRDLQQMQQQQQQQLPFDPFYNFRFLAPLNRHRQNLPEEQRRLQLMRRQRVARPAARNNINNDNNNNSNNVRQPTMFARLLSLSWMRRRQDNNSEDSFNEHSDTEVEQWNDSEENDDDHVRNQNTENSSTTSSSSNSSNDDRTSGSSSSSNNSSISNNNTITSGPSNTTGETIHGNQGNGHNHNHNNSGNEQQQAEISNSINNNNNINNNVDVGINRGDIDGNNNENTANHTNNTNTTNVNGEDQEETVHNNHDEAGRVIGGPIPAPDAWERDGNATVATAATTAAAEPEVNQMTCKDFICNICMDDEVPPNERYSIGCNHAFCLDCWKAYLENQLQDATPAADFPPSCPHQSCQRRMNEEQVRFLTPHAIPKYRRLLLYPFVEGHAETMRWCPGPECDRIAVQSRDNLFIPNNDPVDTTRMRLAQQQTIRALQGLRAAAANNSNNNNSTDNDNNALIGIANRTAHFVCCDACKTEFCFSCGEKPHPGQTCREYATVLQGDSGNTTANAAAATTTPAPSTGEKTPRKIQKCPSCTVGIEKNGGCNHMTCKCGHEFCWLCLADVRQAHGGHFCGQPNAHARAATGLVRPRLEQMDVNADYICETLEQQQQQQEEDRDGIDDEAFVENKHNVLQKHKELQRFAHYYNRFLAHGQGQHFAENQCNCLDGRANEFLLFNKMYTGTDTDFIYLANQRLVASRRLLKYTYCYAYHNVPPDYRHEEEEGANVNTEHQLSNRMALFLVHQERLERVTERLSYLSENAMTRTDRRQVVDMIHTVDRCMLALKDFALEDVVTLS